MSSKRGFGVTIACRVDFALLGRVLAIRSADPEQYGPLSPAPHGTAAKPGPDWPWTKRHGEPRSLLRIAKEA